MPIRACGKLQAPFLFMPESRINMPVGTVLIATTAVAGSGDPSVSQGGTTNEQNGCAVYNPQSFANTNVGQGILRLFPGAQRVTLPAATNPTLTVRGPQEYFVVLHAGNTLQLAPGHANCQQVPTTAVSPLVYTFNYVTRQRLVATVSSTGRITAVAPGECIILVSAVREVNDSLPNSATPPAGETGGAEVYLEVAVRVIP
jgi:hypothetical protein